MKPPTTPRRRRRIDDNLMPMINVVFLLLIFFMVAGRIQVQERSLTLPSSVSDARAQPAALDVVMHADGSTWIDGVALVGPVHAALLARGVGAATIISCRIHRDLPAASLDDLLEAAHSLDVARLQMTTVLTR